MKRRKIRNDTDRLLTMGPFIGRAPRRTGQPEWFAKMMHEVEIRGYLRKLKLGFLHRFGVPEKVTAALDKAGYRNVWEVSTAPDSHIRRVPGLGQSKLKQLQNALRSNNIATSWSVV